MGLPCSRVVRSCSTDDRTDRTCSWRDDNVDMPASRPRPHIPSFSWSISHTTKPMNTRVLQSWKGGRNKNGNRNTDLPNIDAKLFVRRNERDVGASPRRFAGRRIAPRRRRFIHRLSFPTSIIIMGMGVMRIHAERWPSGGWWWCPMLCTRTRSNGPVIFARWRVGPTPELCRGRWVMAMLVETKVGGGIGATDDGDGATRTGFASFEMNGEHGDGFTRCNIN